jgi:hypothetical protein
VENKEKLPEIAKIAKDRQKLEPMISAAIFVDK